MMKENEEIETLEVEEVSTIQTVLALDLPLGDILKNTREEKGLNISEIAQSLCIRESFLVALEEGDYTSFPALVYGAGFLRSYANYLGLDGNSMTQKFHNETSHLRENHAEPLTVSDKNVVPTKRFLGLFFVVVLATLGCYFCVSKSEEDPVTPTVEEQIQKEAVVQETERAVIDANTNLEKTVENVASAPVLTDTLVQQVQAVEEKADTVKSLSEELKALIPTEEAKIQEVPAPKVYGLKEGARLSIKATSKVWVEVKAGEKVVLNKVLSVGDTYNPPLEAEEYELRTGNAGALEVYLDGAFKKVLGRKGHVLKNVKLTVEAYEN